MPLFGPPNVNNLKSQRDIPGLIKALGYLKDARVRAAAASALGEIHDASVVPPLLATLGDADENVRMWAAWALGRCSNPDAVPPLVALFDDKNTNVQMYAAVAILRICAANPVQGAEQQAIDALVKLGAPAVEPLIAAFKNQELPTLARCNVAAALSLMGDPRAVDALLPALDQPRQLLSKEFATGDDVARLQLAAVRALKPRKDVRTVVPLIVALDEGDPNVRALAAEALGEMGDSRAIIPLIIARTGTDADVSQAAAQALSNIGEKKLNESLLAALATDDLNVRLATVQALARLGAPAVKALIFATWDYDAAGKSAAEALDRLGWQPTPDENGARYWIVKREWQKCIAIGPCAVNPLAAALLNSDQVIRQKAAWALGDLGDAGAVKPLIAALKDSDEEVRVNAISALGKLRDVRAVQPIMVALKEKGLTENRFNSVVIALGQIGGVQAMKNLISMFRNTHRDDVRRPIAQALVEIYHSKTLADKDKVEILALRDQITHTEHVDGHDTSITLDACVGGGHPHSDYTGGVGVAFPL